MSNYYFDKEKKKVEQDIEGCHVVITFNGEVNPDLKKNILWHLTQCYEDRIKVETEW